MKLTRKEIRSIILSQILKEQRENFKPLHYSELHYIFEPSGLNPIKTIYGSNLTQTLEGALEAAKPFLENDHKVFYIKLKRNRQQDEVIEITNRDNQIIANVRNDLTPREALNNPEGDGSSRGVLFFSRNTFSNPERVRAT